MKTRALVAIATCLLLESATTLAADRWCGDTPCPCPQASLGWMLFNDSNRGTPDFWWTPSVDVREIFVCEHGVQFLFLTRQRGLLLHTALVFPKPSRRMLAARLGLAPGSEKLESEYAHFRERYDSLLEELRSLSGGSLVEGTLVAFDRATGESRPVIVPNHRLELRWRGEVLKLRGYLDVYFAPVP
jgi:hypothetical protein